MAYVPTGFYFLDNDRPIYVPHPNEMQGLACVVVEKILNAKFYPDVAIVAAEGGVRPALDIVYLMGKYNHPVKPEVAKFKSYETQDGSVADKKSKEIRRLNSTLEERPASNDDEDVLKVLGIDDLTEKGGTKRETEAYARKIFGRKIEFKFCDLWSKLGNEDFFGRRVTKDWILLYKDFGKETYEELQDKAMFCPPLNPFIIPLLPEKVKF